MTVDAAARGRARAGPRQKSTVGGPWSRTNTRARPSSTTMAASAINGNGPGRERDAARVRSAHERVWCVAEMRWRIQED